MAKARRRNVEEEVAELRREVGELARGDGHVIAGPFVGEVGFELLYWVPFVRWAVEEEPSLRERLVLVSRGGTAAWAADVAAGYVDLFSLLTPDQVLARRPALKQRQLTDFDGEILTAVRDRLGVSQATVLHPSLLFNLYYRAVKADRRAFAGAVENSGEGARGLAARYRTIESPGPPPADAGLPDDYVAVRFYARPSLPDTPENRDLVHRVVANIARKVPVVLLGHDMQLDDHSDLQVADGERVRSVAHLMRAEDNLDVQTRVLAGARAFVGTYGGLAYLAPHLGLPSIALSSTLEGLQPWHLDLAHQVFETRGFGPLAVVSSADAAALDLVFGGLSEADRTGP